MLNERYQISAVPVGGGERIQGYYCYVGWTRQQKHYIVPEYASAFYGKEINPDTIEPVRAKPKSIYDKKEYVQRWCPNCDKEIMNPNAEYDYCPECGMALDWNEVI